MSLSPRAKDLLRAAAPLHEPSKEDEARVLASLAEKVAAAGSLTAAGAGISATSATTKAGWLKLALKITAVAFVAPASVGLYLALDPSPRPSPTPAATASSIVLSPNALADHTTGSVATTAESARPPTTTNATNATNVANATNPSAPPSPAAVRANVHATEPPGGAVASVSPPSPAVANVLDAPATPIDQAPQPTPTVAPSPPATAVAAVSSGGASSGGSRGADPGGSGRNEAPQTSAQAGLADELALLRQAEQALRAGEPTRALAALDEHARRFPAGSLAEERTVSRILALCAAGRTEEASALARTFVSSRPHSPHIARVRASCGISGAK